jgi:hypothetical protein
MKIIMIIVINSQNNSPMSNRCTYIYVYTYVDEKVQVQDTKEVILKRCAAAVKQIIINIFIIIMTTCINIHSYPYTYTQKHIYTCINVNI